MAKGDQLSMLLDGMAEMITEAKADLTVIVAPLPRHLWPCCPEHDGGLSDGARQQEQVRIMGAVWAVKRELYNLVQKSRLKNVVVINPMEVLGVKDSVTEFMGLLDDGLHLTETSQDALADAIIQKVEETMVNRKRGPTERVGPDTKRMKSSSSWDLSGQSSGHRGGSRGGRGGRGGYGGWGGRGPRGSYRGGYSGSFSGY